MSIGGAAGNGFLIVGNGQTLPCGTSALSNSSPVTTYLIAKSYFDTSTASAYGSIECRRECVACQ